MRLERISEENRKEANCFIEENWFTTDMAIRGELIDMTRTEGFAAYEDGEMCGLVTYRLCDDSADDRRGTQYDSRSDYDFRIILNLFHQRCACAEAVAAVDKIYSLAEF